ncbi:MAG TPA: septum site-determining protein MinC [Saliniramus sp.]|nr:septum site-determining protein MinC [Saliniramus sp.]
MTSSNPTSNPIRFRGRSFVALVLAPELPFGDWLERLDTLAERSAGFFLGRPIVLDVAGVAMTKADLAELIAELHKRNVRIMGIEGAKPSLLGLGLPPEMRGGRPAGDIEAPETAPAPVEAQPANDAGSDAADQPQAVQMTATQSQATPSLIIETPIRSGQSVVFPEGDVTVLGSVASGAEIVAGGSIHIYGTLRGRAIAGSIGNANARIFCQKLEAELVAIDGLYKTAEDMDTKSRGRPVQFWLEGDALKTAAL